MIAPIKPRAMPKIIQKVNEKIMNPGRFSVILDAPPPVKPPAIPCITKL